MKNDRFHTFWIAALVTLGMTVLHNAVAEEVQVNSADPASAEQGTVNLDVNIGGKGFDNSAEVFFLVAGSENPGGITVNDVRVRGPKKLIANIDISDTAIVSDFDIEVRLSGGRGGKGTTLFHVRQKSDDAPTPVEITARWLPSYVSTDYPETSAAEDIARSCPPDDFLQPQAGNYFCPHQIWPYPIDFDFSDVSRTQTKKNGDEGLCAAMDGITMVANTMYTWAWQDGPCKDPGGCQVYSEHWFTGDEVRQAVADVSGISQPPVDFVRLKASTRVYLGSNQDANPFANNLDFQMHTAVVRFVKAGTNRDAAVCVYDWLSPETTGYPLVLETYVIDP